MKSIINNLKNSKLFKDSFWAVFGNGIGSALFLSAGILIARLLGKDLYGEYGVVKSTMLYIASFATFGLGFTSTKFISQQVSENKSYIRSIIIDSMLITLVFSSLIAILLLIFAEPIAEFANAPSLSFAFRVLAIIIIFKALTTTQIGILSGLKSFRTIAVNSMVSGLFMLIACIPLSYFWGLTGALSCLFLSQVFNFLINQVSIHKINISLLGQIKQDFKNKLVAFSFPVALQESSFTICNWCAIILLTKYASVGEMGLYSASSQWNAIILMIPSLLTNVVLSYLSSSVNNKTEHKKTVAKMLLINFFCTLIPFVFVFFLADFIASFYGPSFGAMSKLLRLLTFATIFECCSSVFKSELMAQGRTWMLFSLRCIRDVILILTAYLVLSQTSGQNGAFHFSLITVSVSAGFFLALGIVYTISFKLHNTSGNRYINTKK